MPRIAFPNKNCLRRDRSDALIKPEGPGNSGTTANTAGCALPGSRRPVLPVAPRPTLHFRNGVSEHVLLQTALTPSLSQRVPATQIKNPPCNNTWWTEIKRTAQSPPCVFAGSVVSDTPQRLWLGAQWTIAVQGPKRESIWRNVQQAQTAPRKKARRADEATEIAISPSASGEARGACVIQEEPVHELQENEYP